MDFAYDSSLASSELRLLQPLAVNRHALRFETRRVPRAYKPRYTAISYTWGNEDASEVIWLDDRPFRVRPNYGHVYITWLMLLEITDRGIAYGQTRSVSTKPTIPNVTLKSG